MVLCLARQSVIIKSRTTTGIILGNYECAYAMGVLSKVCNLQVPETLGKDDIDMLREVQAQVMGEIKEEQIEDENAKNVFHMLSLYKPDETIDGQMEELYQMGRTENRLWQI